MGADPKSHGQWRFELGGRGREGGARGLPLGEGACADWPVHTREDIVWVPQPHGFAFLITSDVIRLAILVVCIAVVLRKLAPALLPLAAENDDSLSIVQAWAGGLAFLGGAGIFVSLSLSMSPSVLWASIDATFVSSATYIAIRVLHGAPTSTGRIPEPRLYKGQILLLGVSGLVGALKLDARWAMWPFGVLMMVGWALLVVDGFRRA